MIDRLILSVVLGTVGWNGLFPDPPTPPAPPTLKQKAKERSTSALCEKKKKSTTVKKLCAKWQKDV